MATSYKRHNRNPFLKLLKDTGGEEALADTARSYFEERDVLLDVDRLLRK
jgi:hypothetical protein